MSNMCTIQARLTSILAQGRACEGLDLRLVSKTQTGWIIGATFLLISILGPGSKPQFCAGFYIACIKTGKYVSYLFIVFAAGWENYAFDS